MTLGGLPRSAQAAPRSDDELEELLSRPTPAVIEALRAVPGDVIVIGAGGKMGPSLTAMVQRAVDALGDGRRVYAASRWSNEAEAERLEALGVRIRRADLSEPGTINALPYAPNVIFMAGQKFGTQEAPGRTWMINTVLSARVAERYRAARIVAFSTGNVYPLSRASSNGAREEDPLSPVGEYAASCVGRERVFEYAAAEWGTRVSIIRLNYAVDLRYGVLVDLAQRVLDGQVIDLSVGYVNCIWQGDANTMALRTLPLAASPPFVLNVTGTERLSVRATALEMGRQLDREPQFAGREADDALLSDTGRAQALFGPPSVGEHTLATWVAEWLRRGGTTLGKATRFERRDGSF